MRYITFRVPEKFEGNGCHLMVPEYISKNTEIHCEIVQCMGFENTGCSLMKISDPKAILKEELKEREKLVTETGECTIDRISPCRLTAFIINKNCIIANMISKSGCILVSSIDTHDGFNKITVIGPGKDNIKRLLESLKEKGIDVKVVHSSDASFNSLLTPKQEETLKLALELGYYDRPKGVNLNELAEQLDCSKSTLCTTLRTAEKKILSHYINSTEKNVQ